MRLPIHLDITMRVLIPLLLAALLLLSPVSAVELGSMLLRTFVRFDEMPLTLESANAQGLVNMTSCVPGRGIKVAIAGGPTAKEPSVLYFTDRGQLSGFGTYVFGEPPETLVPRFWRRTENRGVYELSMNTRDEKQMCNGATFPELLGDRLELGGLNVPLNASAATAAQWMTGNCIPGMGQHYSYDLAQPSSQDMTWNATSLLPILPMYNTDTNAISAVLINIWDTQMVFPRGQFEGPFPVSTFCKNWCADSGCHFDHATVYTTMHWMFTDPDNNTCRTASCKL